MESSSRQSRTKKRGHGPWSKGGFSVGSGLAVGIVVIFAVGIVGKLLAKLRRRPRDPPEIKALKAIANGEAARRPPICAELKAVQMLELGSGVVDDEGDSGSVGTTMISNTEEGAIANGRRTPENDKKIASLHLKVDLRQDATPIQSPQCEMYVADAAEGKANRFSPSEALVNNCSSIIKVDIGKENMATIEFETGIGSLKSEASEGTRDPEILPPENVVNNIIANSREDIPNQPYAGLAKSETSSVSPGLMAPGVDGRDGQEVSPSGVLVNGSRLDIGTEESSTRENLATDSPSPRGSSISSEGKPEKERLLSEFFEADSGRIDSFSIQSNLVHNLVSVEDQCQYLETTISLPGFSIKARSVSSALPLGVVASVTDSLGMADSLSDLIDGGVYINGQVQCPQPKKREVLEEFRDELSESDEKGPDSKSRGLVDLLDSKEEEACLKVKSLVLSTTCQVEEMAEGGKVVRRPTSLPPSAAGVAAEYVTQVTEFRKKGSWLGDVLELIRKIAILLGFLSIILALLWRQQNSLDTGLT